MGLASLSIVELGRSEQIKDKGLLSDRGVQLILILFSDR